MSSTVNEESLFKGMLEMMQHLDKVGKGLAENDLDITAKISALVLLLEKKGILTLDEFDQLHEEIFKRYTEQAELVKNKPTEKN